MSAERPDVTPAAVQYLATEVAEKPGDTNVV
jgi:hypothetical protein